MCTCFDVGVPQLQLTWQVAQNKRSHRNDIQLCLDVNGPTPILKHHHHCGVEGSLLANDALKKLNRGHVSQAGTQLDKKDDESETSGNVDGRFELGSSDRTSLPVLGHRDHWYLAGEVVVEKATIVALGFAAGAGGLRVGRWELGEMARLHDVGRAGGRAGGRDD